MICLVVDSVHLFDVQIGDLSRHPAMTWLSITAIRSAPRQYSQSRLLHNLMAGDW